MHYLFQLGLLLATFAVTQSSVAMADLHPISRIRIRRCMGIGRHTCVHDDRVYCKAQPITCSPDNTDQQATQNKSAVAIVLGKAIYLHDSETNTTSSDTSSAFEAMFPKIVTPLIAQYVSTNRLEATTEEIDAYKLAIPSNDEIARIGIERWKFFKSLYDKYGGRVRWQQLGWEPEDAFFNWLQDEERAGNVKILDTQLKAKLWKSVKPRDGGVWLNNNPAAMELIGIPPWKPAARQLKEPR